MLLYYNDGGPECEWDQPNSAALSAVLFHSHHPELQFLPDHDLADTKWELSKEHR